MKNIAKIIIVLLCVAISGCGPKIVKSTTELAISPPEMNELNALPKGKNFSQLSAEDSAKALKLIRKSMESAFNIEKTKALCVGQPNEKVCMQQVDAAMKKFTDMLADENAIRDSVKDFVPIDLVETMHAIGVSFDTILLNIELMKNIKDEDEAAKLQKEMASGIKAKVMADLKIDEARFKELEIIGKKLSNKFIPQKK